MRRPARRALAALAGVALVAGTALLVRIVWPRVDDPVEVDAVVALAGDGWRTVQALGWLDAEATDGPAPRAPTLVVSGGPSRAMRHLGLQCGDNDVGPDVVCFTPDPVRTVGEARAIGALAREHGWEHVAVVTSTYHLTRARTLVGQCLDARLSMVEYPVERTTWAFASRLPREVVGLVAAVTVDRAC